MQEHAAPGRDEPAARTAGKTLDVDEVALPQVDAETVSLQDASTAARDAAAPSQAPAPVAASRPDEIVEISIGAIHLRVDAPSPGSVAQPPASAAARITSSRSPLSRRALYRI
jgi:hypothetical protein